MRRYVGALLASNTSQSHRALSWGTPATSLASGSFSSDQASAGFASAGVSGESHSMQMPGPRELAHRRNMSDREQQMATSVAAASFPAAARMCEDQKEVAHDSESHAVRRPARTSGGGMRAPLPGVEKKRRFDWLGGGRRGGMGDKEAKRCPSCEGCYSRPRERRKLFGRPAELHMLGAHPHASVRTAHRGSGWFHDHDFSERQTEPPQK